MCRIASLFFFTEVQRKHVRRCTPFQRHRDASNNQVYFFLQGKAPKEIHAILTETLREHAPSYATVKNWVAQFKRSDFSYMCISIPSRVPHNMERYPATGRGGPRISGSLRQCFSTAGPRPGIGPWHELYRAARGLRKLQCATRFH